ncbi:MAG: hypothetical protein K0U41_09890 [Gammaproteobacteria bacterium]|nr:hypothetical protein [Gammaproteobacteria bacterium]
MTNSVVPTNNTGKTDIIEQVDIDNAVSTINIHEADPSQHYADILSETMKDLHEQPGMGMPLSAVVFKHPGRVGPAPLKKGEVKTAGRPKLVATQAQKQYVFNNIAVNGTPLRNMAQDMGLGYETFKDLFALEIALGKSQTKAEMMSIALMNMRKSSLDKGYLPAVTTWARLNGHLTDKTQVDVVSSDGSMSPMAPVMLMPPSPHAHANQDIVEGEVVEDKDNG